MFACGEGGGGRVWCRASCPTVCHFNWSFNSETSPVTALLGGVIDQMDSHMRMCCLLYLEMKAESESETGRSQASLYIVMNIQHIIIIMTNM